MQPKDVTSLVDRLERAAEAGRSEGIEAEIAKAHHLRWALIDTLTRPDMPSARQRLLELVTHLEDRS
ncbi:hypothetical protein [Halorhodospira sp. 9622]|uniref:hypothetical protein n=1 Tax=Halorhodospira sp. 9622 TaxID=2899136 RepID=UPI001EE78E50|nr:hypothetical protein [Halorhodospira sp. 9622]MCG5538984.1 hypothetical protein [Halorhodospira sp. 9622]